MLNAELITFSPLHIGDGEEILPFEYIVEGSNLKVYPFDYFTEEICRRYEGKELLSRLVIFKEVAKEGLKLGLEEFLKRAKIEGIFSKYELSVKNFVKGKSISSFIKTLQGPYIPGSEIKGSLRTVFLYNSFMNEERLRQNFYQSLERAVPAGEKFKKLSNNEKREVLQKLNRVFQKFEQNLMRAGKKDAQYDLFKSLIISDSQPFPYEWLIVDEVRITGSSQENLNEFCEFLKAGKKIKVEVRIDEFNLKALKALENFGIYSKNLREFTWGLIKKSACRFYLNLVEAELDYFQNMKMEKHLKFLKKLKTQIEACQNTSKLLFPIRLGKFEGYLSLTLMLMVKRERPELFERIFKLSVPKPRAIPNKTRKVLKESLPGWCFLYIKADAN